MNNFSKFLIINTHMFRVIGNYTIVTMCAVQVMITRNNVYFFTGDLKGVMDDVGSLKRRMDDLEGELTTHHYLI